MKIGTRSLLFGVHHWLFHPLFVGLAWWRLFGCPWDPRLWIMFLVHDWGYWGADNMDGSAGRLHPILGARIVSRLFDRRPFADWLRFSGHTYGPWGKCCLLHSRSIAKVVRNQPSRLCLADKYAIVLTPAWLYLPLAWMSGELAEYIANGKEARFDLVGDLTTWSLLRSDSPWSWLKGLKRHMHRYVFRGNYTGKDR